MGYQVLARKWRPKHFADVVGQEHVLRALINALDSQRLHHTYLFTGTRGVGKTTLGRILAKSLNCETGVSSKPCGQCSSCMEIDQGRFVDLLEVDAASRTKVEDTRELLDNVQYAPTRGRYKVYLIDEVHMLSNHSFNALLKTLEEPPPHVKFILATTDPQKLPVTILSRCLQFSLQCIPLDQIVSHLQFVLEQEQIQFELDALRLVARAAQGSMRDALSLLDQAIAHSNSNVQADAVRSMLGYMDSRALYGVLNALASQDGKRLLDEIEHLAQSGVDFQAALSELLSILHQIALLQVVPDSKQMAEAAVSELAQIISAEDVQLFYQIGLQGQRDIVLAPDLRVGFEMIVLRMLAFRPKITNQAKTQSVPAAKASPVHKEKMAMAPTPSVQAPVSAPVQAAPVAPAPAPANQVNHEANLYVSENPEPVFSQAAKPLPDSASAWAEALAILPLSGMVRQLAMNSAFQGLRNQAIQLQVASSHRNLVSKNFIQRLAQTLSQYYCVDVKVDIAVTESIEQETPAIKQSREKQAQLQSAIETVNADPNVKTMQELFGAAVDPRSVQVETND
ncbi:MAG: DNA polymerase III subunit gamma/tau [Gammaproteobacteria bacterium]|nr:DNA polymerase III subunit gamma/tau [Gammaproteobacteria bacterium]